MHRFADVEIKIGVRAGDTLPAIDPDARHLPFLIAPRNGLGVRGDLLRLRPRGLVDRLAGGAAVHVRALTLAEGAAPQQLAHRRR